MEINKTTSAIRKTLQNRELQVSNSAWDRLELQLDTHQTSKRKRNWSIFAYAASIACLLCTVFALTLEQEATSPKQNSPIRQELNEVPVVVRIEKEEETIAEKTKGQRIPTETREIVVKSNIQKTSIKTRNEFKIAQSTPAATQKPEEIPQRLEPTKTVTIQQKKKGYINTSKLLASIAKETTAQNEQVLANVSMTQTQTETQTQTKGMNTVKPSLLLTEVEEEINEDTFKNTFVKRLSSGINTFATAFTERNKTE